MFTARNTVSFAIAATATMLIVAGSAAPVSAATSTPVSVTIHTSAANLATPEGFAQIKSRVKGAANRLCGQGDSRALAEQMQSRACVERALAAAMPQLETLAANARGSRNMLADAALPTAVVSR